MHTINMHKHDGSLATTENRGCLHTTQEYEWIRRGGIFCMTVHGQASGLCCVLTTVRMRVLGWWLPWIGYNTVRVLCCWAHMKRLHPRKQHFDNKLAPPEAIHYATIVTHSITLCEGERFPPLVPNVHKGSRASMDVHPIMHVQN
jgi:hypothetical protein